MTFNLRHSKSINVEIDFGLFVAFYLESDNVKISTVRKFEIVCVLLLKRFCAAKDVDQHIKSVAFHFEYHFVINGKVAEFFIVSFDPECIDSSRYKFITL